MAKDLQMLKKYYEKNYSEDCFPFFLFSFILHSYLSKGVQINITKSKEIECVSLLTALTSNMGEVRLIRNLLIQDKEENLKQAVEYVQKDNESLIKVIYNF